VQSVISFRAPLAQAKLRVVSATGSARVDAANRGFERTGSFSSVRHATRAAASSVVVCTRRKSVPAPARSNHKRPSANSYLPDLSV